MDRRRINHFLKQFNYGFKVGREIGDKIFEKMPHLKRKSKKKVSFKKALGYQAGRSLTRVPPTELKCFDVSASILQFLTPAAGTSIANPLNVPLVGSELYQRVGRKIYMKSIQIKGYVYNTATALQSLGRIYLIYDSQANGAAPTVGTVFNNMDGINATNGLSMINLNNRQRYKIIRDHQFTLPAVTYTAGVLTNGPQFNNTHPNAYSINWYIPLNRLETIFNQINGGSVADIVSGSLLIGCMTDVANNTWSFTFCSRLRYYD